MKSSAPPFKLSGTVAAGFEPVQQAFEANFTERREIGADVAVYHKGKLVVDLWAGHQDLARRIPWSPETVVLVYSVAKGMASTAMALAHSRGWIDFDAPVSTYWPEFSQGGKEHITIRQLLAHQAGLSALDSPLTPQRIADTAWMSDTLARQTPSWEPGTRQGYHGMTLGSYMSQIIARVDPKGRHLQAFFAEEIAQPLGISFHLGLPEDFPEGHVAPIKGFPMAQLFLHLHELPWRLLLGLMWPGSLVTRSLINPKVANPADFDGPDFRPLDFASAVGFGQARAIATVYGDIVSGESRIGLDPETVDLLLLPFQAPSGGSLDKVMGQETAWHLGYSRDCSLISYRTPRCFGMRGASGADGFADPDTQMGFGYTTNRCSLNAFREPRVETLIDAVYQCL